jgi:hypothetical protein
VIPAIALCLLTVLPLRARAAVNELGFSPTSLMYGQVEVGRTLTVYVAVTNHGKSNVTIWGIEASDSTFKVSPLKLPKILAAGAKLGFNLTFAPAAPGWVGGHVAVISSATDRVLTLELGGTGVTSKVTVSPASISFGKVSLGESSTSPVVLTNTGPSRLTLQNMKITGSAFSVSGAKFPLILKPGQTAKFEATFKPKVQGLTYGSFFIFGPAVNIPLTGSGDTTASKPLLTVAPATLSFGNVGVGTTKTLTLGLGAAGEAVTISSVSSSSSQFALPGVEFPLTIPAGHELSLNVTFTPQNSGNKSATLSFASNAENSPSSEPLAGAGTPLYVTLSWNPSTSEVSGYNVYRSTSPTGALIRINSKLDSETTYTDATIMSGTTYYYATKAVSPNGQQSAYSNRVEVVVP